MANSDRPYCVGCGTIYDGHHNDCPVMAGDPDATAAQDAHDGLVGYGLVGYDPEGWESHKRRIRESATYNFFKPLADDDDDCL